MNFSIIIINYNNFKLTKSCLESLLAVFPKEEFEVILVDNGSSDGSTKKLNSLFGDKINILESQDNLGFAKANNMAAQKAKGNYLFFLNNDTIIKSDMLSRLKEGFEDDKVGVLAPVLKTENGSLQDMAYGSFPTLLSLFLRFKNKRKIEWVSGAALAIRKDIFLKVDGFDERFFMYFEDIDICKKVADLGYDIRVQKDCELIHLGGRSLDSSELRKTLYYESQDRFYKKYYTPASLFFIRIGRFFYRIINKI